MVYNAAIPQSNNNISVSQGNILENFSQLNTIFAKDHYTWDDNTAANRGWQKQVTFPSAIAAGAPGASGIIHTVLGTAFSQKFNGIQVPFFSNSAGDFPMMGDPIKGAGNDFSFKIGGIIFNCGFNSVGATSSTTVTFNTPVTNVIYAAVSPYNAVPAPNDYLIITSPTNTDLTLFNFGINPNSFYYIAIGY